MTQDIFVLLADGSRVSLRQFATRFGTLEVAHANDVGAMRAAAARSNNTLSLGLTAKHCRNLAADLVEAANTVDGGSGPKH